MLCVSYALCAQAGGIWHMLSLSAFIITVPLLAKKHAAAKVGRSQHRASMHARACPVVFVIDCGFCIACCCCCCCAYGCNTVGAAQTAPSDDCMHCVRPCTSAPVSACGHSERQSTAHVSILACRTCSSNGHLTWTSHKCPAPPTACWWGCCCLSGRCVAMTAVRTLQRRHTQRWDKLYTEGQYARLLPFN